ncbi:hypothetical protein GX586_12945 [bacterium]|nr:hypothetical protein [bacterium]
MIRTRSLDLLRACAWVFLCAANALPAVIISELSAAASERLLEWSDDGVPSLGAGIPWRSASFDDNAWLGGTGAFGFGYAGLGTDLGSRMRNIAPSLYTRRLFAVSPAVASSTNHLVLSIEFDDAFVAFLNGREVARQNLGCSNAFVCFDQPAYNAVTTRMQRTFPLPAALGLLVPGTNVLAIQACTRLLTDAKFMLSADLAIPGATPATLVSHDEQWKYFIGRYEPSGGVVDPRWQGAPAGAAYDTDFLDWLELHNTGPTAVCLRGWALSDDPAVENKWLFPDTVLTAGQYLIVYCSGLDLTGAYLHTNFKLSADGEFLSLFDNSTPRMRVHGFAPAFPAQSPFHTYAFDTGHATHRYFSHATPGAPNAAPAVLDAIAPAPVFDTVHGIHATAVTVSISTTLAGGEIRYTTNGTEPTACSGQAYTAPLAITSNTVVRAAVFKSGCIRSPVVTRTYLIGVPAGLRAIPSLSLAGDEQRTFFEPYGVMAIAGGYYTNSSWKASDINDYNNPSGHGRPFERPVSFELLYPDGATGVAIECGLRVHGHQREQFIRTNDWTINQFCKFPLRTDFRQAYGSDRLRFALFPGCRMASFRTFILRAGSNDARNPFIKDELSRRLFIDCGQVGSYGMLAHLYINGAWKGYYNICERADESFMQSWYDSTNAWDVHNSETMDSGDMVAWNAMYNFIRTNNMAAIDRYLHAASMLEITNFVEYLLVNIYTANGNWPSHNWIAARERIPGARFHFHVWDAESTFSVSRTNYDTFAGVLAAQPYAIPVIYRSLSNSPEFRLLFADRIQKQFFGTGAFTDENVSNRFVSLRAGMTDAVWHVYHQAFDSSILNAWIPKRRGWLFQHFTSAGVWFATCAPVFSMAGGVVSNAMQITITNVNASGTIYYTTDGADPRAMGGGIAGMAYTGPLTMEEPSTVKARVLAGSEWSPLAEAACTVQSSPSVVVTEIMYDPPGGREYEFIEVRNVGSAPRDVSTMSFVTGVTFSFAAGGLAPLATGAFAVVVGNVAAFASRYATNAITIAGEYQGALANEGEEIVLRGPGGASLSFFYDGAWFSNCAGNGASLVINSPYGRPEDWSQRTNWHPSAARYGTPGYDDVIPEPAAAAFLALFACARVSGRRVPA